MSCNAATPPLHGACRRASECQLQLAGRRSGALDRRAERPLHLRAGVWSERAARMVVAGVVVEAGVVAVAGVVDHRSSRPRLPPPHPDSAPDGAPRSST